MKKLLLFSFLIFTIAVKGQTNLVPNPSFEDYSQCPTGSSQINYATGWNSYRETPDYYNACSTDPGYSVPNNYWNYKPAATGNAYAGIITYYPTLLAREFIGIKLSSPLIVGTKYYVSFKAIFTLKVSYSVNTATNGLGVQFSTISYSEASPFPINNFAHVYTSSVITDTTWTTISGSFTADVAYEYLILGNFFDDVNTDTISYDNNPPGANYLIDDVTISDTPLNISGNNLRGEISIYPTVVKDKLFISFNDSNKSSIIRVFNTMGVLIQEFKNSPDDFIINTSNYAAGIYFIKIEASNKSLTKKIIVTK